MTIDDLMLLAPAFVAGVLVLLTHVPLGRQVLARGIIFLDLAIAQLAATGALLTLLLVHDHHGWEAQLGAGVAALTGALLLNLCEKHWPDIQEALIGSTFVLAATLALLLLASDPHGGEALRDLLAGQILWVTWEQMLPLLAVTALVLVLRATASGSLLGFYLPFALAVTVSVQMVGVYLVFSSLILPALAVRRLPQRAALAGAVSIGVTGYALGLMLSWHLDLPAGPAVVWGLALCALAAGQLVGARAKRG
jgi:zinc/manganese transport system permease protein